MAPDLLLRALRRLLLARPTPAPARLLPAPDGRIRMSPRERRVRPEVVVTFVDEQLTDGTVHRRYADGRVRVEDGSGGTDRAEWRDACGRHRLRRATRPRRRQAHARQAAR